MRLIFKMIGTVALFGASSAEAGVFTDDLSRCMVERATDTDKTLLARWMFAAMSKDPALIKFSNITQSERDNFNKSTAALFSRLLLIDCRPQSIAALKNEGESAFGDAGQVLGQAAAQKLMSSPEGQAELEKLGDYVVEKEWEALAKEAGITKKAK